MIRRPPRSTLSSSSAASDVYKRQCMNPCCNSSLFVIPVGASPFLCCWLPPHLCTTKSFQSPVTLTVLKRRMSYAKARALGADSKHNHVIVWRALRALSSPSSSDASFQDTPPSESLEERSSLSEQLYPPLLSYSPPCSGPPSVLEYTLPLLCELVLPLPRFATAPSLGTSHRSATARQFQGAVGIPVESEFKATARNPCVICLLYTSPSPRDS